MKITKTYLKQVIKEELSKMQEVSQTMAQAQPGEHISATYERMTPQQIAESIFNRLDSAQRPHSAVEEFIRFGAYSVLDKKTENKYRILDNAKMVLDIYEALKKKDPDSYPEYMSAFRNAFQNFKKIFETIKGSA